MEAPVGCEAESNRIGAFGVMYECDICGEKWDEFNDCKSHVYNKHGEEHCGFADVVPSIFVSYND